jgi:uncharacterized protein
LSRTLAAITGASSGIGAAFARKLSPEHDLLLIARRKDRLQQLAIELSSAWPSRIEVMQADLTTEDGIAAVAERLRFDDRLALLVNNAGFGTLGRFWEAPIETQEAMHRLHVMATVRLTHAALRNMVPRDFGGIINVASVAAFLRNAGSVSYGATKSWMTSFTEGLYIELRGIRSNVSVQALCPGFTYSEFHSALGVERERLGAGGGWWATSEEVVDASLDGLRNRRLFVIPGWRYRLLTTFFTKIPTPFRLIVELLSSRARAGRVLLPPNSPHKVPAGE